jgi:membrane fusion protein (multidrug efflux system)
VDKKNKVKMTNIKIGTTLRDSYMVESGLKKGDLIIYEGTQSLKMVISLKLKRNINLS